MKALKKHTLVKRLLFNTLGNLKVRTETLDDVLILTSSRSGSTWLNESLQHTKEFKLYNQPFDRVLNRSAYNDLLPANSQNPYYANLSKQELKQLINFWDLIRKGSINPNTDWKFYAKEFNFFYKRKLIKSFFTKDQMAFYTSQPDLKIIYLLRNPIDRGISNINYGYKDFGDVLFKNNTIISSDIIDTEKLYTIYTKTTSELTQHVIAWYLENFTAYNYLKNHPQKSVLLLHYETMVNHKTAAESTVSDFIFDTSDFKLLNRASKTTLHSKKTKITPKINLHELQEIRTCLPQFMPYLERLDAP